EMQVRPGRSAGTAHLGDLVALVDDVARPDEELASMGVACQQPVAVVDVDLVAISRVATGKDHHARTRGTDRRTPGSREIEPFMASAPAGERVHAAAEARCGIATVQGTAAWHQSRSSPLEEEFGFDQVELVGALLEGLGHLGNGLGELVDGQRSVHPGSAVVGQQGPTLPARCAYRRRGELAGSW